VPEGQNLDDVPSLETVVEMVMNSREVKPSHVREISVRRSRTDIGLRGDELESASQLLLEHAGRRLAVLTPPKGGLADLPLGVGDDP
jgi:hypothetical protein